MPIGIYKRTKDMRTGKTPRTEATKEKLRVLGLGRLHSEETKRKMSKSHIGMNTWMKGKKRSEETKRKIGEGLKGNQHCKGRHLSEEHRRKISEAHKGSKGCNWKGGLTAINITIRHSLEYRLWREAVFKRDNYACIWCGVKNGNGKTITLNADHIKPFALYPELRFAIDNGRTLCQGCHLTTETFGNGTRK